MKQYTAHERKLSTDIAHRLGKVISPTDLRSLRHAAITLRKLYECECNGCTREKLPFESWAHYDVARAQQLAWVEKRVMAVKKRIRTLCNSIGIKYYLQTDPRGCALYLGTEDAANYSTEGVAIY